MLSLILAAAVVGQGVASNPTPVKTRPTVQTTSDAQERAVVARRRAKKAATARTSAIRDAQADIELARQETEYKRAMAAQREYEIRMGPIWAAEHANQVQEQRNALIAQRNAIAKYQADYDIWLRMQQNSIDAAGVQALQRR